MEKDFIKIFARIKTLIKEYENPLTARIDLDSKYDLWSVKDLVIAGRKRKEVYYAGLVIRRYHVGFYCMPVYTDTNLKNLLAPELLKLLKGKACFHLKYLDSKLEEQIRDAIQIGFDLYKERGWI